MGDHFGHLYRPLAGTGTHALLDMVGVLPPYPFNERYGLPGASMASAPGHHGNGACEARLPRLLIVVFPLKEFHGQPEASNTGDCISVQWLHRGSILAALPSCSNCTTYLHRVPVHSRR